MSEKQRAEMCEAIVKKILDLANEEKPVSFESDWGGNSITVNVEGQGHTHCGLPDSSFDVLVEQLYNSLHGGPGLSWA